MAHGHAGRLVASRPAPARPSPLPSRKAPLVPSLGAPGAAGSMPQGRCARQVGPGEPPSRRCPPPAARHPGQPRASRRALTRAAVGTLAVERGHAVVAGGAVEAGGAGAVVDVLTAVLSRPAVDAHARVAAVAVVARPAILAGVRHQLALVHVLGAVLTCGAETVGPGERRRGPGPRGMGSASAAKPSTHQQPEPLPCRGHGAPGSRLCAARWMSPKRGPDPGSPAAAWGWPGPGCGWPTQGS